MLTCTKVITWPHNQAFHICVPGCWSVWFQLLTMAVLEWSFATPGVCPTLVVWGDGRPSPLVAAVSLLVSWSMRSSMPWGDGTNTAGLTETNTWRSWRIISNQVCVYVADCVVCLCGAASVCLFRYNCVAEKFGNSAILCHILIWVIWSCRIKVSLLYVCENFTWALWVVSDFK